MAFTPYCPPKEPPACEPEPPPCEPPPVNCEPEPPPCEPPPPPVICEPEPPPVACEPVCPPPHAGGDTGDSTNTISAGGNAGNVTAGSGTYVDAGHGAGTGGGLLNLSLLNGIGGSNILSPSIGGPSVGLGAIFDQDVAGNGGKSLLGSLFGKGGNTGDSTNTISAGGDAGDVTAGSGTYADAGGGIGGGLLNISALNGLGGSNILSPSIGGPSVGLGAIFDQDVAGNGGKSLLGSLFGKGGDTGDSTNTISAGGDAGDVTAGSGTYMDAGSGIGGGLLNISALNGLGGSNILSPSIGGPSVGLGAILDQDVAGNGGKSLLGSLFGKGGDTGNSTNTISAGGDAGDVTAGSGTYMDAGSGIGGGLLNISALNGLGGSNILSPSIGGPSVGLGAIFDQDVAGNGGKSLLGSLFGKGGDTGDSTNTISAGGDAGDVTAGSGTYADAGSGIGGGLLNISALNGLGGSNILSPSIGGPSVGLGAILDQDVAGNGGKSLLGSLFGKGGDTGDSTNTISAGGDAGDVTAGSGVAAVSGGDIGGLINAALLNGVGGSNILSPSIGGPSVGIGAILDQDVAGNGGKSLLGSLFGKGGDTGDSTNTISAGGDAGDVTAGSGVAAVSGGDIGGLINAALLNGVGGSNILSPSLGGPSLGIGAIFDQDLAGIGGHAYDGHVPLMGNLASALGSALDLLTTTSSLFDVPTLDVVNDTLDA